MRTYLGLAFVVLLAACGGGGGNPGPGPTFLAAQRYFPSPLGATYVYRSSNMADPLFDPAEGIDFNYTVSAGPGGGDITYAVTNEFDAKRAPIFSGLSFKGLAEGGSPKFVLSGTDTADVLPATLTGIGQSWPLSVHLGKPTPVFTPSFVITGTATLAALEDVTVGSSVVHNCVRVDAVIDYSYLNQPIPGLSISYWLAPDVGPVLAIAKVGGLEVGRVQLIHFTPPA